MALQELLQEKRQEILALADKHGAFNVQLFGSVAHGDDTPESDINFLIDYDLERVSAWFPVGLIFDLEDLLGYKVDVVTEKGLHWYISGFVRGTEFMKDNKLYLIHVEECLTRIIYNKITAHKPTFSTNITNPRSYKNSCLLISLPFYLSNYQ